MISLNNSTGFTLSVPVVVCGVVVVPVVCTG